MRGISVRLHFSTELATDIDSAEDLERCSKLKITTECRRVLEQIIEESPKAQDFLSRKLLFEKQKKS